MTGRPHRSFKRLSDLFFYTDDHPPQEGATPIVSAVSTLGWTSSSHYDPDVKVHPEISSQPETPDPTNRAKRSPAHRSPGIMTSITGSMRGMNRSMTKRFAKQAAKYREPEEIEQNKENVNGHSPSPIQHSSPIPIPGVQPEEKPFVSRYPAPALELDLPQSRLSSGSLSKFMSTDRHDSAIDIPTLESVREHRLSR